MREGGPAQACPCAPQQWSRSYSCSRVFVVVVVVVVIVVILLVVVGEEEAVTQFQIK